MKLIELTPSPNFFIISICPIYVNVHARFDEIPSMTFDIKETKRYGRMDVKTVYPPTNTVCGGIMMTSPTF